MSAFVVSKKHIDMLVQSALVGCVDCAAWPTDTQGREPFSWWHDDARHRLSRHADRAEDSYPGIGVVRCEDVPVSTLGQRLVDECVRSVAHRYPDDDIAAGQLPGPCDAYYLLPYAFEPITRGVTMPLGGGRTTHLLTATTAPVATVAEVAKALDCYEYQSCEHPEWMQSEARAVVQALRGALLAGLPGYKDAPWEWA